LKKKILRKFKEKQDRKKKGTARKRSKARRGENVDKKGEVKG